VERADVLQRNCAVCTHRNPVIHDELVAELVEEQKVENPFADVQSTLQTSGSIMRGVQIGTNRDFSLNSGLNVELSGKLTEDVEIVAALTDEATPIQPEGNTQTLNEIDKVFWTTKQTEGRTIVFSWPRVSI
jgi:hypothetical protein